MVGIFDLKKKDYNVWRKKLATSKCESTCVSLLPIFPVGFLHFLLGSNKLDIWSYNIRDFQNLD